MTGSHRPFIFRSYVENHDRDLETERALDRSSHHWGRLLAGHRDGLAGSIGARGASRAHGDREPRRHRRPRRRRRSDRGGASRIGRGARRSSRECGPERTGNTSPGCRPCWGLGSSRPLPRRAGAARPGRCAARAPRRRRCGCDRRDRGSERRDDVASRATAEADLRSSEGPPPTDAELRAARLALRLARERARLVARPALRMSQRRASSCRRRGRPRDRHAPGPTALVGAARGRRRRRPSRSVENVPDPVDLAAAKLDLARPRRTWTHSERRHPPATPQCRLRKLRSPRTTANRGASGRVAPERCHRRPARAQAGTGRPRLPLRSVAAIGLCARGAQAPSTRERANHAAHCPASPPTVARRCSSCVRHRRSSKAQRRRAAGTCRRPRRCERRARSRLQLLRPATALMPARPRGRQGCGRPAGAAAAGAPPLRATSDHRLKLQNRAPGSRRPAAGRSRCSYALRTRAPMTASSWLRERRPILRP